MISSVEKYAAFCSTLFGKQLMDREANFLRAELFGRKMILDVGCGIGTFEERISDFNIIGVDNDEEMLKVARKRAPHADFCRASALQFPFPNNLYDAVFFVTSFEFIEDYRLAVDEANRVTKPNGKLLVMMLNPESEYFNEHFQRINSYFRRIKRTDLKEVQEYISGFYQIIKEEYFLGIDNEKIFDTSDKKYASLYVIVGTKTATPK